MPDPTIGEAIWEEPPRGSAADISLLRLPGLEQLQSFVDGRSALPPVARLTGRRIVDAELGRVVYALPVSDWVVGPKGTLHPGVISFLADAPLFASVQSMLPPGALCTTAEVSTTFLGSANRGDELLAEGRVIHTDGATGLAEAFIRRVDGALIGHATARLFIFPPMALDDEAAPVTPPPEATYETPDPYLRPVAGGMLTPLALSELSGLELLQRQLAGELARPPIDLLTGIRLVAAEEGRTEFTLRAHGWGANEFGTFFGGLIALLAASAGSSAVQTIAGAGTAFKALDLKINLIRPIAADGGELRAIGSVVHRGDQLAISSTEITDGRGRRVAVATGTTMLGSAAETAQQPAGVAFEAS